LGASPFIAFYTPKRERERERERERDIEKRKNLREFCPLTHHINVELSDDILHES
jgi:hypothetical protein